MIPNCPRCGKPADQMISRPYCGGLCEEAAAREPAYEQLAIPEVEGWIRGGEMSVNPSTAKEN